MGCVQDDMFFMVSKKSLVHRDGFPIFGLLFANTVLDIFVNERNGAGSCLEVSYQLF